MKNIMRELRIKKSLKAKDIAKECNISVNMLYQIEREEKLPSLKNALTIAKVLEKPVEKIFLLED